MPKLPGDMPEWADADRISDVIIDLANDEVKRGVSPLQVFAGLMLGLLGVMRSAPPTRPVEFNGVEYAIKICLNAMLEARRKEA